MKTPQAALVDGQQAVDARSRGWHDPAGPLAGRRLEEMCVVALGVLVPVQ